MILHELKDWLEAEGGRINRILQQELTELPKPAQPVLAHILNAGGKRLRPLLLLLIANLLGNKRDDMYRLASSMEMLHAATLLHDDVLDNSDRRRGKASAHIVFNVCSAILGGDALLAHGNAIVASFGKPELVMCFSKATAGTAAGEILEMSSLRNPEQDLSQYLEIAKGKTACLIAQSCAMGALAADADERVTEKCECYGENLGIAFQIVDDALDFAPQSQTGKPRGGDLREGKMTPPILFYRASLVPSERKKFDSAFSSGIFSPGQFDEICADCAAFIQPAMLLADTFLDKARSALVSLPDGTQKDILNQIVNYVRLRSN